MISPFSESTVEDAALAWLEAIGWQIAHGPDIAPDMQEKATQTVLEQAALLSQEWAA